MKKITGDLWKLDAEVKVVPTNARYTRVAEGVYRAHMGAGVAKQAADLWRDLPLRLGLRLHEGGNHVYVFLPFGEDRLKMNCSVLVTFPTKQNWREASILGLIERSARELALARRQNGWATVLLPQVGCGLGGLNWVDVEPVLDKHLDHHFTVVVPEES